MPSARQIGAGFIITDTLAHQDGDDGTKVSPARCQVLFDGLNNSHLLKESASTQRDYQKSDAGPFVSVYVSSHPAPPAAKLYAGIAEARSGCSKFTETDTDGTRTAWRVVSWSPAKIGDHTVSLRLVGKSHGATAHISVLETAVGKNTVGVAAVVVNADGDPALVMKAMNATLARLPS